MGIGGLARMGDERTILPMIRLLRRHNGNDRIVKNLPPNDARHIHIERVD